MDINVWCQGMTLTGVNEVLGEIPVPVPPCPSQARYELGLQGWITATHPEPQHGLRRFKVFKIFKIIFHCTQNILLPSV
jgi:hypothetical protein